MSVRDWTPEKRLTVELRKVLRDGHNAQFVSLPTAELPEALPLDEGEMVLAEMRTRHGHRFFFSDSSLLLEQEAGYVRVPYESVIAYHWIDDDPDIEKRLRQKREHGDRLIVHDRTGGRYVLDGLGPSFQAMHNFFSWLIERRST